MVVLIDSAESRRSSLRPPRLGEVRSFYEMLHFKGFRISETAALTVGRVDLDGRALVLETLKRRKAPVWQADNRLAAGEGRHGDRGDLLRNLNGVCMFLIPPIPQSGLPTPPVF